MTSPVRIDAEAWGDLRFATLARIMGFADRDHALIKVARIWSWQTEHYTPETPTYVVDRDIVDSALGDGGVAALVRARLAEELPEGVRMKGTNGRIEWLWKLRQAGVKGGESTRERHSRKPSAKASPSHVAPERSRAHTSDDGPRAAASPTAMPGHVAIDCEPDNVRQPRGSAMPPPMPSAMTGPLTPVLDLDQRSEDLFLDGREAEGLSPGPSGDRDREGLTFEAWKARRAPIAAPRIVRTPDSCKPGDGAAAIAEAERLRGTR